MCGLYLGGCEEVGQAAAMIGLVGSSALRGGEKRCVGRGEILGGTIAFCRRSRWGTRGREKLRGGGGENLLRKEEDDAHQLPGSRGGAPHSLSLPLESRVWAMGGGFLRIGPCSLAVAVQLLAVVVRLDGLGRWLVKKTRILFVSLLKLVMPKN